MKLISLRELLDRAIKMYNMEVTKTGKPSDRPIPHAYRRFFMRFLSDTQENNKSLLEKAYNPEYMSNSNDKYYFSEADAKKILNHPVIKSYCMKHSKENKKVEANCNYSGGKILKPFYVTFYVEMENGKIEACKLPINEEDVKIVISEGTIARVMLNQNPKSFD